MRPSGSVGDKKIRGRYGNLHRLNTPALNVLGELGKDEFSASEADVSKHVGQVAAHANMGLNIESDILVQRMNLR